MTTHKDALRKALDEDAEYLAKVGGCSDGGCLVSKPKGMHTNGGCRCSKDHIKMQRLAHAHQVLVKAVNEALAATVEPEQSVAWPFPPTQQWLPSSDDASKEFQSWMNRPGANRFPSSGDVWRAAWKAALYASPQVREQQDKGDGITVWRRSGSHPYPWRFSIAFEGKQHDYAGLPNQCETMEEAYQRAAERYGWMQDGSYDERYIAAPSPENKA